MNITEIKKLLEMFDASESVKLKLTNEGFEISLEKTAAKAQKVAIPANPANLQAIQSVESAQILRPLPNLHQIQAQINRKKSQVAQIPSKSLRLWWGLFTALHRLILRPM